MPLLKPNPYVHPNKRKRQDAGAKTQTSISDENEKKAVNEKGPADKAAKVTNPKRTEIKSEETVVIRLVARVPQSGFFKFYDELTEQGLSPKEAILGIWKREFSQLEIKLSSFEFSRLDHIMFEKRKPVETTRKVDQQLLRSIRSKIDPHEILTIRALGQKIGEALLMLSDEENEHE